MPTPRLCRGPSGGPPLGSRANLALHGCRHSRGPVERCGGAGCPRRRQGDGTTRRKPGPLGAYDEGYSTLVGAAGLYGGDGAEHVEGVGPGGPLARGGGHIEVGQPRPALEVFREYRREAGFRRFPGTRALRPLLAYLREVGVVPPPLPPTGELEDALGRYRAWLVADRGLARVHGGALRADRAAVPAVLRRRSGRGRLR